MTFDPIDALIATAKALNSAMLVGNPAPFVKELHEWMQQLEPGCLVVEMTSRETSPARVGILEKIEATTTCPHIHVNPNVSECGVCTEDERWIETYYWITVNDGTRHRWYNCEFLRIPHSIAEWQSYQTRRYQRICDEAQLRNDAVEAERARIARRTF